eukprot:746568-Prymnesium_polylepis.2
MARTPCSVERGLLSLVAATERRGASQRESKASKDDARSHRLSIVLWSKTTNEKLSKIQVPPSPPRRLHTPIAETAALA